MFTKDLRLKVSDSWNKKDKAFTQKELRLY